MRLGRRWGPGVGQCGGAGCARLVWGQGLREGACVGSAAKRRAWSRLPKISSSNNDGVCKSLCNRESKFKEAVKGR